MLEDDSRIQLKTLITTYITKVIHNKNPNNNEDLNVLEKLLDLTLSDLLIKQINEQKDLQKALGNTKEDRNLELIKIEQVASYIKDNMIEDTKKSDYIVDGGEEFKQRKNLTNILKNIASNLKIEDKKDLLTEVLIILLYSLKKHQDKENPQEKRDNGSKITLIEQDEISNLSRALKDEDGLKNSSKKLLDISNIEINEEELNLAPVKIEQVDWVLIAE